MITMKNVYSQTRGQRLITTSENPQISTWGIYDEIVIEAPVYIGKSQIEAAQIGAFTFINMRSVHHETTNCVIECQSIGRFCMIAHSVNVGLAGHPTDFVSNHLVFRYDDKASYAHDYMQICGSNHEKKMKNAYIEHSRKPLPIIGNDVWIGYGATVMNGVSIGNGAVIAACSVVTKDIPAYSIVGGNPAKVIRYRFNEKLIRELEELQWWDYGADIMQGIDLDSPEEGIKRLKEKIYSGKWKKYRAPVVLIRPKNKEMTIIS